MRNEVDDILNKDKQNKDIILLDDYVEKNNDNNIINLSENKSIEINE
jgi:hypothetical protein